MSTQAVVPSNTVAPGVLCEPCYEQGRRIQAKKKMGEEFWCKYCLNGVDPPRNSRAIPPRSTKPVHVKDTQEAAAWRAFFAKVDSLEPGWAIPCECKAGRSWHTFAMTIRRWADIMGFTVRIDSRDSVKGILLVMPLEGNPKRSGGTRKPVDLAKIGKPEPRYAVNA